MLSATVVFRGSRLHALPYLTLPAQRWGRISSAQIPPNAQPRCKHKVTVIGCEAEQITSHLGPVFLQLTVTVIVTE